MKRSLFIGGSILAAILLLVFIFGGSSSEEATPGAMLGALPVEVVELKTSEVPTEQELPGRTAAFEVAEIRPQVTGIITERLFVEGAQVEQGQQLYQIDPAPYLAAYRSAEADLLKAKANLRVVSAKSARYSQLGKIGAVSTQNVEDIAAEHAQAEADVSIAEAKLATTKIDLDYTKVYAPLTGRIGKSSVTKGALVTANQAAALATITKLDPIYVDLVQPAADLMAMRASLKGRDEIEVKLAIEGSKNYSHVGKLQFADVTVEATTGSVNLRAIFPNPDELLLPGMFIRAKLDTGTNKGILIPQRATTRRSDGSLAVWVLNAENAVEERLVSTSGAYGTSWLVTSGLQPGERVVVTGLQKLRPGAVVQPSPYVEAAAEAEVALG